MPRIVPSLLLVAAVVPALAAVDADRDRVLRAQEGEQRSVATQAEQLAARASLLSDDLRYNNVGDADDASRLTRLSDELSALVQSPDSAARTMIRAADALAQARRSDTAADIAQAAAVQSELVGRLDDMARNAQGRLAAANGVDDLRAAIDAQRRLLDETGRLADQTLGKDRLDLGTQEKSDLERLARQQDALEKMVQDITRALHDQAQQADTDAQRANLESAARALEQGTAARDLGKAADDLRDNRMAEAQESQGKALDRMEEAERQAAGAQRSPMAELDKRMQRLEQTRSEQQRLLDESRHAQAMSKTEADRLSAREQDIARDLSEQGQAEAQQSADQARQAMQQGDKAQAESQMQQTLQRMDQALAAMKQQQAELRAAQDSQQQQSAQQQLDQLQQSAQQLAQAQQAQQALLEQLEAQAKLSKKDAADMAAAQAQIAAQLAAQPQAQQQAQQAQQALEQRQKQQAQQQMQSALQQMQQAQQQMQQQMQQLAQAAPSPAQPGQGQPQQDEGALSTGERAGVKRSGWDVELLPRDREVLSQVKADRFPARYEQALVQYYRALAEGSAP